MSRVLEFELFYHKHLVGRVSKVAAEFPSYHCTIDLSENTLEGGNLAAFEKQRKECIAHHQLVMDGDFDAANQYEKNLPPATLGRCSWYTKTVDEGVDCRIRTPYFGQELTILISSVSAITSNVTRACAYVTTG